MIEHPVMWPAMTKSAIVIMLKLLLKQATKRVLQGRKVTCSHLVDEVVEAWDASLKTLSGFDVVDESLGLGALLIKIGVHELPMVKHALRGKARPEVTARRAWVKTKDSATGRKAFMLTRGVTATGFSLVTIPRRWERHW